MLGLAVYALFVAGETKAGKGVCSRRLLKKQTNKISKRTAPLKLATLRIRLPVDPLFYLTVDS